MEKSTYIKLPLITAEEIKDVHCTFHHLVFRMHCLTGFLTQTNYFRAPFIVLFIIVQEVLFMYMNVTEIKCNANDLKKLNHDRKRREFV